MFELTTDWWAPTVRVSVVYVFLLVLMRLSGKRQLGQITPMDFLTILLVSETVSPALTDDDTSLTAGAIAAGTLFVISFVIAVGSYRSRRFERAVEGAPVVLVEDGKLKPEVLASERITMQELETALRAHGVARLSDVTLGVVETSGEISFIKRE
jgi:uncharacterized membrane protein YcaP (DUF421 family)